MGCGAVLLLTKTLVEKFDRLYHKYHDSKDNASMSLLMNIQLSIHTIYADSLADKWGLLIKSNNYKDLCLKQRRNKVRKYVRGMVDTFDRVYLVTLTFNDYALALLSEKTRLRYVREFLNKNTLDYFACIDYGKINGREHFHALCSFDSSALTTTIRRNKSYLTFVNSWQHGYVEIKPIGTTRKDIFKSCAYAFKASDYAFKNADSTHRPFHKRGVEHWLVIRDSWDRLHSPF